MKFNLKNIYISLFFISFLILGLLIFKDFGISSDEGTNRRNGAVTAKYLAKKIAPGYVAKNPTLTELPDLHDYIDKDYGVFVELPMVGLEVALKLKADRDIYYMRHLITFLIFFVSVFFFYKLQILRFKDWRLALIGCLMLIISPRIFADAFYNSKDLVFMSFCIISTFTCVNFFKKQTIGSALWHGFATAATINIRILGIIILVITIGFILISVFYKQATERRKLIAKTGIIYISAAVFLTIMFWPYLWENPIGNFITALKNMGRFRWPDHVLYFGKEIIATDLPWHYCLVWIVISTPILYTILFFLGSLTAIKSIFGNLNFKKFYLDLDNQTDLLFLSLFICPLISVIVLHSVLYDGWRQMYFIYPYFLLLSLRGVNLAIDNINKIGVASPSSKVKRVLLFGALTVNFGVTTYFMIRNHPYQNVYFSFLSDNYASKNFEKDYWALSSRAGLEFILEHDKSEKIKIANSSAINIGTLLKIMPETAKDKIEIIWSPDEQTCDYLITNHRYLKSTLYKSYKIPNDGSFKEIYAEYVDGIKILSVYKKQSFSKNSLLVKN
ncbi:hypothetical protein ACXZ1K_10260 [Pedobacter sp. PWIIR3]